VHIVCSGSESLALMIEAANSFEMFSLSPRLHGVALELHSSGLTGTTSHPDMQKMRITELFFENMLQWQFQVQLLLFTVCTCV